MRRVAIIDSDDEDEYAPRGVSTKESSNAATSSRSTTDSPATRLTSPVSETADDEEKPRPRKRTTSSASSFQTPIKRSRNMIPYVDIVVKKSSSPFSQQKRKSVPLVEITSSQSSSPRRQSTFNRASIKIDKSGKEKAKVADKGKQVQAGGSRQLTLSRFFAPPASKKAARE